MQIFALEDISCTNDLLPFTATRSVLDIRMGILTSREKWDRLLGAGNTALVDDTTLRAGGTTTPALPANILPTRALAARIREEQRRGPLAQVSMDRIITHGRLIRYPWQIFQHNAEALIEDFHLVTAGRQSQPVPPSVATTNPEAIFIEEGARLQHCVLN